MSAEKSTAQAKTNRAHTNPSDVMAKNRWIGPYVLLFLFTVFAISASEAILLSIKYDYFKGGFLVHDVLNTGGSRILFAFSSLILDAALILVLWTIFIPLLFRLLRLSNDRTLLAVALITAAIPISCNYINYELHSYLSDAIDFKLLWQLGGSSPHELIAQWGSHMKYSVLAAGIVFIALISLIVIWRRNEIPGMTSFSRINPPSIRKLVGWTAFFAVLAAVTLVSINVVDSPVYFGLMKKPSGVAMRGIIQWASDLDRDGYGLLSKPKDPAPWNGRLHPYAIDIPGNGIDENGVAGDHPANHPQIDDSSEEISPWNHTPNVLLILLESVRADVLERKVNGRDIAPFMRKLAAEGAQSTMAYSHCGYTAPSRAQLYGGRMQPYPGQTTLIDDFKRNGYYVAYFSGQDDSFADSGPLVGYDKADTFYDARVDKDKRCTPFSNPAGLAVSGKLVNQRVLSFLNQYKENRPLFLYVNYQDTHFPYHHRELDNILDIKPIPRKDIRPGASEAIWRTYANAAANVDRSMAELFAAWSQKLHGKPLLVLIVSDHAESLFENGFLGHGYSVEDQQTRIPFVVWGAGGTWYEPLGLADIRGQLLENMVKGSDAEGGQPQIIADPSRRVVQHIGSFKTPRLLAWRSLESMTIYDFWNDVTITAKNGASGRRTNQPGLAAGLVPFIWNWEAMAATQHENGAKWHRPE